MSDNELFFAVVSRLEYQYGLDIERPYDNGCMIIFKNNEEIGCMNSDGYNLLSNLTTLCGILEGELL